MSVLVTSDAALRRYCSSDISALSAIKIRCIILRYINFLFYSILLYSSFAPVVSFMSAGIMHFTVVHVIIIVVIYYCYGLIVTKCLK